MRIVLPREAGEALRGDAVALVPTDTVVGLAAGKEGLPRLFEIKGREPGKLIALLCRSAEEAFALAAEVPSLAHELASRFWPGPLTLVLDAPGGGTVGVRVPDHGTVRAVLEASGGPLYVTSANPSRAPACGSLAEVDPVISSAVDFAVEGEAGRGEASAVVDLSGGEVQLLRPAGWLSEELLERLHQGV